MSNKKKTYQFDLQIRLIAEANNVDAAFEAALGKLDPEYVQIRSEVTYKETSRDQARLEKGAEPEAGVITKDDIGIEEGLEMLLDTIFGKPPVQTVDAEELLKEVMGDDN